MVDRDDLPDGGARYLAATGRAIKARNPEITVEYLSSDMMGMKDSIALLVESRPEILGHNVETVRRLNPVIRSRSDYDRSLNFSENRPLSGRGYASEKQYHAGSGGRKG